MTVANTNGAGAVVNGESGGGAGLPTAAGADEVPVSTGAGTTYTATPLTAAVGDTIADLYGALDAGDFYVSDGAGVVPASSVPATVRTVIGAAATVTTTRGDLIRRGASADERVALGTAGYVLTSNGTDAVWAANTGGPQPTTLAAHARAEALRRRGPLAMRSTGSAGTASGATTDTTPDLALSTSGVLVVYAGQAGGYASQVIAQSGVWATRGYYVTAEGGAIRLNWMQATLRTADLAAVVGTVGWHAVAWSIPADGLTVRYSVDGGTVATASPSATPLVPVARNASDAVYVGTNGAGSGTTCGVAYLAVWESILSDGDLVTLSTSPSAGAPSLPSTPAWEWASAAFAGVQAVTIDGTIHEITGSPQVWMP